MVYFDLNAVTESLIIVALLYVTGTSDDVCF